MTQRQDQLSECNVAKVDLPSFEAGWCRRCIAPECTRSLYGQSRFDIRVNTWEDRLFKNPPKMATDDPRYNGLSAQRFITIDTGRTPEIRTSNWIDPSDAPVEVDAPTVPEVAATPEPLVVAPASTLQRRGGVAPEVLSMNAKSQAGRTLPGVEGRVPTKRDAWAVPEPAENVVPVGATVKLGGSGV